MNPSTILQIFATAIGIIVAVCSILGAVFAMSRYWREDVASLKKEVADLRGENKELRTENTTLKDEIRELKGEIADLYRELHGTTRRRRTVHITEEPTT